MLHDWRAELQSSCQHIHIAMIRCFLDCLVTVSFVIERKACSIVEGMFAISTLVYFTSIILPLSKEQK